VGLVGSVIVMLAVAVLGIVAGRMFPDSASLFFGPGLILCGVVAWAYIRTQRDSHG